MFLRDIEVFYGKKRGFTGYRIVFYKKRSFNLFANDKKSNRHASVDGLEKQLFFIRWEITQLFLPVYLPLAMQSTCTCRRLIDGDVHLSTA